METKFQGFYGIAMFLDDILITDCTPEVHLENLKRVVAKLKEVGLKLNHAK